MRARVMGRQTGAAHHPAGAISVATKGKRSAGGLLGAPVAGRLHRAIVPLLKLRYRNDAIGSATTGKAWGHLEYETPTPMTAPSRARGRTTAATVPTCGRVTAASAASDRM